MLFAVMEVGATVDQINILSHVDLGFIDNLEGSIFCDLRYVEGNSKKVPILIRWVSRMHMVIWCELNSTRQGNITGYKLSSQPSSQAGTERCRII
jgi:hypothetical protein